MPAPSSLTFTPPKSHCPHPVIAARLAKIFALLVGSMLFAGHVANARACNGHPYLYGGLQSSVVSSDFSETIKANANPAVFGDGASAGWIGVDNGSTPLRWIQAGIVKENGVNGGEPYVYYEYTDGYDAYSGIVFVKGATVGTGYRIRLSRSGDVWEVWVDGVQVVWGAWIPGVTLQDSIGEVRTYETACNTMDFTFSNMTRSTSSFIDASDTPYANLNIDSNDHRVYGPNGGGPGCRPIAAATTLQRALLPPPPRVYTPDSEC